MEKVQLELDVPEAMEPVMRQIIAALEQGELEKAARLLGVPRIISRHAPYKHRRWARCEKCFRKQQVAVYAKRGARLRDQRCTCGGRLHAANWRGWT